MARSSLPKPDDPTQICFGISQRTYEVVRIWVPAQPVDATQALNLSAGVSNAMVLRGRSFKRIRAPLNAIAQSEMRRWALCLKILHDLDLDWRCVGRERLRRIDL
jgi:hypothetical protein